MIKNRLKIAAAIMSVSVMASGMPVSAAGSPVLVEKFNKNGARVSIWKISDWDLPNCDFPVIPDMNKPGSNVPDVNKPENNRPEGNKPEINKPETNKPENNRPETNKPETNRPEANKPDTNRPEANKPETDKPETNRPEIDKPETNRPETDKPENNKPETNKPENNVPETGVPEENRPQQPDAETPESPEQGQPENGVGNNSFAMQVIKLVNAERKKEGLPALRYDAGVERAALLRAKETVTSFSHTRPDGRKFNTALNEMGVNYRGAGENIAWGQKSPEAVMKSWMESPGHRANILNKNYTTIGVGYYQTAQGTNYWTQLFTY